MGAKDAASLESEALDETLSGVLASQLELWPNLYKSLCKAEVWVP